MVMFPPPTPDEGPPVSYDALSRRRSAGETTLGDIIPQLLGGAPPPSYGADIQRASDYTRSVAANTPEPVDKSALERSYLRAVGTGAPPPVAPPPTQEMIRAHQPGHVPSSTGAPAEPENVNSAAIKAYPKEGITEALQALAYQDAPRQHGLTVGGIGGGTSERNGEVRQLAAGPLSGYQQAHDRAVEGNRNQYYDEAQRRIDEQANLYDPQRRNLEAEGLNAAYEALMPGARPAGEDAFPQEPDGTFQNTPAPPRINQSANAQQVDLARGMAGVSKNQGRLDAIDKMVDAETVDNLNQVRSHPNYAKLTPEQRRAAEASEIAKGNARKTQYHIIMESGGLPAAGSSIGAQ